MKTAGSFYVNGFLRGRPARVRFHYSISSVDPSLDKATELQIQRQRLAVTPVNPANPSNSR
jgi:hypothetical protein